jgi:hypothetical protein
MMAYPVIFDVTPPEEFDKAQVALRVVIVVVLSILQIGNIIFGGIYLLLPVLAAVLIAQKGPTQYLEEAETGPTKWLRYILGYYSYMALATDKIPMSAPEEVVDLKVEPNGEPSVGSSLLRIILAIPHAIVLGLLGIIFAICWIVGAIAILINGTYPEWASGFIRGYLRWTARVMVYMASLVDEYPPFSFEAGEAVAPTQPSTPEPAPPAEM